MPSVEHRRVLIVDDNIDSAELIAALFNLHGATAIYADSGAEALRVVQNFLPHVVFLDLAMPGMDGFTVLAEMKKIPQVREARFVALTAWSGSQIGSKVVNAGFDRHLQKPASVEALLQQLI